MTPPLMMTGSTTENETHLDPEALLYHLEECWDESVQCTQTVSQAREALQGAWISVSGRREAKLLVSGNRFTVHFRDGDIYMGVLDLEPAHRPRRMDMHIDEGPARHRGQSVQCIYQQEAHTLRWCAPNVGRKERMRDFPDESDPNYLCLVFRRQRCG